MNHLRARRGALVSVWCAGVLAAVVAPPDLVGDAASALGLQRAVPDTGAVADARASGDAERPRAADAGRATNGAGSGSGSGGGAATPATPGTVEVQGIRVDGTLGTRLTADGGEEGLAPRLVVTGAGPGSVGVMQLRVRNTGARDAGLELTRGTLTDAPGPYGGRLSGRLRLRIADADGATARWNGVLGDFRAAALGTVPAGGERRWRLWLTFPDGGPPPGPRTGDNALQGAGLEATYVLREP